MDDVKRNKIYTICKCSIILLFVLLSFSVAIFHEPWSDEAQSFLLARDNSIGEIFKYSKLEGTFPLWFLLIKLFITLGGKYETYYILPILFSTIGVAILEFKIKAPKLIKVLLPFTFFIFYQYTIIARSYCLVLPILMAICSIYHKRKETPALYCILLLLFMTICSYTFVIAGSFFIIDLIECYKTIKNKDSNEKEKRNIYIIFFITFFELLLSFLMLIPDKDCSFTGNGGKSLLYIIYQATIGNSLKPNVVQLIGVFILFLFIISVAVFKEEDKRNKAFYIFVMMMPVLAENMIITCEMWHIGIIAIMIFTVFILNDMINTNNIIKWTLTVICIIQVIWSANSAYYDIYSNYSGSKDVASFLKENNYQDKVIYGLGFDITAILPYFENNIFKNQNSDKSFWIWSKSNGYNQKVSDLKEKADIYVISTFYKRNYAELIYKLYKENYKAYYMPGFIYTKNFKYQTKGYMVFIKEDIINMALNY